MKTEARSRFSKLPINFRNKSADASQQISPFCYLILFWVKTAVLNTRKTYSPKGNPWSCLECLSLACELPPLLKHKSKKGKFKWNNREISLLNGLSNYQLNKLHRVLKVCNAPTFCHISHLLRGLHWLPVKARIQFKILLITFKAIHGLVSTVSMRFTNI